MRILPRTSTRIPAAAVAVGLALVASAAIASFAPTASAAPASPGAAVSAASLFGGVLDVHAGAASHEALLGGATYGFVSNVTQIDSSATTSELVLQEVYGISLSLSFCRPSCAQPYETTNISYNATESYIAWTNITDVATITPGNAGDLAVNVTQAIGILNSHVVSSASVRESVVDRYANGLIVRDLVAQTTYAADSEVSFVPALGIVPVTVLPRETWTSASAYLANATWSVGWSINQTGAEGDDIHNVTQTALPFNVTLSGTAGFAGSTLGRTSFDSHDVNVISYRPTSGRLTVVGSMAIAPTIPQPFFGDLGAEWERVNAIFGEVSAARVYMSAEPGTATLVQSSAMSFGTGVRDSYNGDKNSSISNQTVPGQSMSQPTYNDYASCLQSSAASCPATIGPAGSLANLVGPWAALGVAVVVISLIATVFVARRRQLPPAHYPNAALYPPGSAVTGRTARRPSSNPPPPVGAPGEGAEDDPLNQLW